MGERLKDKVCVITGATSGIGRAAAELFAEEGGKVVFAGRRADQGAAAESGLRAKGYDAKFVQTDITSAADREKLVREAIGAYGRIDVLFNNAGTNFYQRFEELDMEKADLILDTNYRGMFALTRLVVPIMIGQGGNASIVNTASIGAVIGSATCVPYCGSKGAVKLFTQALAAELGKYNIRVNALLPGLTLTDMTLGDPEFLAMVSVGIPLDRGADPREIAYGALFLAGPESSFMTGHALVLDGGFTAVR
ncbi:MAG: SDR family oxidoreductase [Clostridiales Family XIII bacterium]|nr:SDR family oxidoreductase [Clostridiales Family XIII bacterium]